MDAFPLWLGITLSGTVIVLVGIIFSERREQLRLQRWVQPLRCPECGGEFAPPSVARSAPPRMTPSHGASIPEPPALVQATCAACGLTAVFTETGEPKRTYRASPAA
ncbi:hypothetical protein HUA74_40835 [Myxococcus sp. CA051A]|uniref:hypothetical protein n=1 Tax=unclassified Myxococcus TaxID=2648731 RepID=UPI00157A603E|nr:MULTISPECIES: hypothetical protein [unclassified Myxococcus]NTX16788.1 hypothetical protein [Myxococcus sp. CA056]NTX67017.1 hypothetical protein [Myxococcus sp. CA051A]